MSSVVDRPQVVITRKDKRLHKGLHLAAFMLTGGASGAVTAAKAGTNSAYNARTSKLAGQRPVRPGRRQQHHAAWRAEHVPGSKEYKAAHPWLID